MEYFLWLGLVAVMAIVIWLDHRSHTARISKPLVIPSTHTYDDIDFGKDQE